ncbi:ion channel [Methanobrevibacter sp.]|uniref:ion channel n=1 Tax=Methanobrevibacter sp. TaxID=66852 RepID=UPI00388FF8CF
MKAFGMEMNARLAIFLGLNALIIVDIVLITVAMIMTLPPNIVLDIQIFDFIVCIILLIEWGINFYISKPKSLFLKQKDNILALIASIPFDVLLPAVIPQVALLRYLRLLKLLRIVFLFRRFATSLERFIDKTNLDKILAGIIGTIFIFTILLYFFGPSYDLFDDFYFVIVTLTTVGYGDVVPVTFGEKVISLILIIVGLFAFSTITAAISSFLTERLLEENTDDDSIESKINMILEDLDIVKKENEELKQKISELQDSIDND